MNRSRDHVAVIDPGTRHPELSTFNAMARRSPLPLTYHLPALWGMRSLLRDEEGLLGVIVLGSGSSVNAPEDWQLELAGWLRPRLSRGLPTLGLCFGLQFVVHLFGGVVATLWGGHAMGGQREVRLDADRLWGAARTGPLVVQHREGVTRLPDGFRVVGRSDTVAVEAVAHEAHPIWGFQSHPEADEGFLEANHLKIDDPGPALAFGHALVDDFLTLVARLSTTDSGR
ncbi:MAG: gamma-glutamyl-gamma-aminobutyrate hydrolase family protein [Myxococcales bacterium]|nr:gamma-glutamyl-gamma-aminobutyrate hydrolase family protein [Myxococcales bacterium]